MNIARVKLLGYTNIFNNPIIYVDSIGEGNYKKILSQSISSGITLFTLKEYNKKIVNFCDKRGIIVEDDFEYLPEYFKDEIKKEFETNGPLNLGIIFENEDRKLANKILKEVCSYARFITIPNRINSLEISKKIFDLNGIIINIEKDIEKICKKCDIIIDTQKCNFHKK